MARVAAQLLDVLARHPVAQQMGGDEMAVAMGREPLGRILVGRVVQPDLGGILHDGIVDAAVSLSLVLLVSSFAIAMLRGWR